jgi:hypothetical protein
MGVVLSKDAILKCAHQGKVTIVAVPPHKLTVGGAAILGPADLPPTTAISGCTNSQAPDLLLTAINAGAATKLTVGKAAVYLKDTFSGLGVSTITAQDAGQQKLTAK